MAGSRTTLVFIVPWPQRHRGRVPGAGKRPRETHCAVSRGTSTPSSPAAPFSVYRVVTILGVLCCAHFSAGDGLPRPAPAGPPLRLSQTRASSMRALSNSAKPLVPGAR